MRVNAWYLLLGLIAAGLVYALTLMIERYEEPVDQGWSEAARRNPFLAAEQFLSELNTAVESSDNLEVLDDLTADTTLVIANANHVLNKQRADDLVTWMEEGGHVVVAAQLYDAQQPDVLLSRFEISKRPLDDGFQSEAEDQALGELLQEASEQARGELEKERLRKDALRENWNQATTTRKREALSIADNIVTLSFEGTNYRFRADYRGSGSLSHPALELEEGEDYPGHQPFYWAGNDKAVGFMQMQVGSGLLTVMADVNIWNSSQIGLFDHAFLLKFLTGNSDQVVFLYGALVPGIFELIWRYFPELSIALLTLLAAWIFHRMRRFGPLVTSGGGPRRSFKEHIQAVGQFLWRQQMGDHLLNSVRQEIWTCLYRRYPGSESLGKEKSLQKLAEHSDSGVDELRLLMLAAVPADEIQFYQFVKSLQIIRKRL